MEKVERQREFPEIKIFDDFIRIHRFGDDETAGALRFQRKATPFEHYVVTNLAVEDAAQGKGFASQLLAAFEKMCVEKHMSAIIYDDIRKDTNPEAFGMYGRREGWQEVPRVFEMTGVRSFVFNLQEGQSVEQLVSSTEAFVNRLRRD